MLLLLFVTNANAAAQSPTTEQYAFGATYATPCQPEPIAVSGMLQTTITAVFNGNVGMVQFHTTDVNAVGVGLSTGIVYKVKVNEFAKFFFDKDTQTETTIKQKLTLQGSGPDNDLRIYYTVRVSFDGVQFHTTFEKLLVDCK